MDDRYMIYNKLKKKFQFPKICNQTEKGAIKELFNIIGNDVYKNRFIVKRITRDESIIIKEKLTFEYRVERLSSIIPNIPIEEIKDLIRRNYIESEE